MGCLYSLGTSQPLSWVEFRDAVNEFMAQSMAGMKAVTDRWAAEQTWCNDRMLRRFLPPAFSSLIVTWVWSMLTKREGMKRSQISTCTDSGEGQTSWPSIAPKTVYELHMFYVRIPSSETNLYSIFCTWYSMHHICDQSYLRMGDSGLSQFLGPSKRSCIIYNCLFSINILAY